MILSEDEARGTACHQAKNQVCKASQCMAWRWQTEAAGYCGLAGVPGKVAKGRTPRPRPTRAGA